MSSRPTGHQPSPTTPLYRALQQAGIRPTKRINMQGVDVIEAEASGIASDSLVIFESKEEGLHLGVRVPLPEGSELSGQRPGTDRALWVLGALTAAINSQALRVEALTGANGLEGYLITAHVCHEDGPRLKRKLERVQALVDKLIVALQTHGSELEEMLRRLGQVHGSVTELHVTDAKPAIVPTFDAQVRDQLMKRAAARRQS